MHTQMNSYQNKNLKINLENISKSFDNKKIIENINIKVYDGEIVSLIGHSGCGKSTVFNIISNLTNYDDGRLYINGNISYMHQKDLLLPYKTIIDNVSLPLILKKVKKKNAIKKVSSYFKIFGLEGYENKYPFELSGGMKQRANFLRTFINSSDIMLLDEPFGALDSITKSSINDWLLDLKKKINPTILFITHDIEEAIILSDRIYLLSNHRPSSVKKEFILDKNFYNKNNISNVSNLKGEILKCM